MRKSYSIISGLSIIAALSGCVSTHREKLPEPKAPAEKMQQQIDDSFDMPVPDVISINRIISISMNNSKSVSKQNPMQSVLFHQKVNERA